MIEVVVADSARRLEQAHSLFEEYAEWLGLSLDFQGFDGELITLPGEYAPPRGRLLLALVDGLPAGCVGVRPLDRTACEMKRLWVRPSHQGEGIGRILVDAVMAEARAAGYTRMFLDTLPDRMGAAVALYRSVWFSEVRPYNDSPLEGIAYMAADL